MKLDEAFEAVAAYAIGDQLDQLKQHIDPAWIEEALTWSGTVSMRTSRRPCQVRAFTCYSLRGRERACVSAPARAGSRTRAGVIV